MRKLLITGGHVTPALAVIDEIQEKYKDSQLVFIGRKFINDRETSYSFEYHEVVSRNIRFIHLNAGRLTRIASWNTFLNALKIPSGFIEAFVILENEKPDAILTFGGYLGLPIALAAFLKGIPVYTHEQTIHPGIANRMIATIAKKIFISFPESKQYFTSSKVVLSGNPIRKSIFKTDKNIQIDQDKTCIYITGGSLGAHSVNSHIERILPQLLKLYVIIHQTGNVAEFKDYERLKAYKDSLESELSERYILKEHFLDEEIGWVYKSCDFVIGRSGANTFFELVALNKPAIFIPLPWSAHDEQREQAHIFKKNGVGEVFEQNRPSQKLLECIFKMDADLQEYKNKFPPLQEQYINNATHTIINHLYQE